jgi:hypothetical protein
MENCTEIAGNKALATAQWLNVINDNGDPRRGK